MFGFIDYMLVKRVVETITDIPKDNVILFPKTVEYYQVQLTRLLETEQYTAAIKLLKFLLQCQGEDPQAQEEWKVLLEWLETQIVSHPELGDEAGADSEAQMLSQHVKDKAQNDQYYTKKLLDMLLQDTTTEHKFLALDQLVFIEHPHINDTLIRWVEKVDLHSLVQFKVLQTLKLREVDKQVNLHRKGEDITLNIQDTPLTYEDYPQSVHDVLKRVESISEIHHPALVYFAEQTWKTFLSYVYGASMYNQIVNCEQSEVNAWAAALHFISTETMLGPSNADEVFEMYDLADQHVFIWEKAYRYLKGFVDTAFRSN